jgi:hypothetical protein
MDYTIQLVGTDPGALPLADRVVSMVAAVLRTPGDAAAVVPVLQLRLPLPKEVRQS